MNKLDPLVKQQWIDALRSGSYLQGFGFHAIPRTEHCAIEVLGEILGLDAAKSLVKTADGMLWLQLTDVNSMNDKDHCSFAEIADYIEANF